MRHNRLIGWLASLAIASATPLWADEVDYVLPAFLPPPVLDAPPASLAGARLMTENMGLGDSPAQDISVMFLYADDAIRLYGSTAAVQSRINTLVDFANTAYANSGVNIHLTNVAQHHVFYDNNTTTGPAFNQLANKTHPAFSEVNRWRQEAMADIVVLLRPRKSDVSTCGLAFLNGGGLNNPAEDFWTMGGYAYAHVYINCFDFVLAHELGHIMGLVHTRSDTAARPYAYGAGYRVTNDFSTVMASTKGYPPPATALPLPYFSSPLLTCTGYTGVPQPCGIDHTLANGADAALALNNVAAQVSLFSGDSDTDGMPDWFEHFWGLNRFDAADATLDTDGDGRSNRDEFLAESYPKAGTVIRNNGQPLTLTLAQVRDTDSDGLLDGTDTFPTIAGEPVFELNGPYSGSALQESIHP